MYMETGIIRNNKVIDSFDFYPSEDLDIYLRSHERGKGNDDWFAIANLTKEEISIIKSLVKTEEEKKYLSQLKEGDTIDVLLHFGVIISNG